MNTVSSFLTACRFSGSTLLAGLLIITAGCGRNSIVGKWHGKKVPFGTMSLPMTIEFKSDGTDTRTINSLIGTTVITDTYIVKGENLQMTPVSMAINGKTVPVPALVSSAQSGSFKMNGDTLALTMIDQAQPVMLTRVKP